MRALIRNLYYLFVVLICSTHACAQHTAADSMDVQLPEQKTPIQWGKALKTPMILISAGLLSTPRTDINFLNRHQIYSERNHVIPHFRTRIDDYIQYAPIAAVYGLNAFGIKGEHDIATQTKLLIKSELIMLAMVCPLKRITAVERPDTGAENSFPSGHTAQAFVAATFLHKEYGKENPMYSVLGYATASTVGALRVMNNRHWISDVLAGAGIGILATNLAYLSVRDTPSTGRRLRRDIVMIPSYGDNTVAMNFIIGLR